MATRSVCYPTFCTALQHNLDTSSQRKHNKHIWRGVFPFKKFAEGGGRAFKVCKDLPEIVMFDMEQTEREASIKSNGFNFNKFTFSFRSCSNFLQKSY